MIQTKRVASFDHAYRFILKDEKARLILVIYIFMDDF